MLPHHGYLDTIAVVIVEQRIKVGDIVQKYAAGENILTYLVLEVKTLSKDFERAGWVSRYKARCFETGEILTPACNDTSYVRL